MQRVLSLVAVLLGFLGLGIGYLSFGGAGWQIRRHFPDAELFFDPLNSPDPSFPFFVRILFPRYVHRSEPVGFRLADYPDPVDLSHLAGLRLHTVLLTRCRITDLRSIESSELHPYIHFINCDFSQLPHDQRHLIRPYDPQDPTRAGQFIYERPCSIPGLEAL